MVDELDHEAAREGASCVPLASRALCPRGTPRPRSPAGSSAGRGDAAPGRGRGRGTADAVEAALGGEWREAVVSDPLGGPDGALAPAARRASRGRGCRRDRACRCSLRTSAIPCAPQSRVGRADRRGARDGSVVARRRARRDGDGRRRVGRLRGPARAAGPDARRALRRRHPAGRRRRGGSGRRRAPPRTTSSRSRRGSRSWRSSARTRTCLVPVRREGSAPRSRRSAPTWFRARPRCSISSASTSASPCTTSSSPGRASWTRRPRWGRRPARSRDGHRRPASAASCSEGASAHECRARR